MFVFFIFQLLTTFKIKFRTAVPPPSTTDKNALKDPTTKLIFPLTIDQTDSKRDISVPTFWFKNSVKPFILNISGRHKIIKYNNK